MQLDSEPTRKFPLGRRLRPVLIVCSLLLVAGVVWMKFEPFRPTAELVQPVPYLGIATPLEIAVHDSGSGLASIEVFVERDGKTYSLHSEEIPATSWRGSALKTHTVALVASTRRAGIPEGNAELVIRARDHSWLGWFRSSGDTLREPVIIDTTPPTLELLTTQYYLRQGGSDVVAFRTSDDAVRSGVAVGGEVFSSRRGVLPDEDVSVALFAFPPDVPTNEEPIVFTEDRAGNRRETNLPASVKPGKFRQRTLEITDDFLADVIPDLLVANGMEVPADPVAGYLKVNRDLRKESERRIREVCATAANGEVLWDGPFLRQPGSATLSKFADRRTYLYDGREIDHQTHFGVDLASLRRSPVIAANHGRVVFADDLGIYGQTVILDHGLGLFSLYGHLSTIQVKPGEKVDKGATLGRTGETGLAGGDHLHFSVLVGGVHVDPVEWWDPQWIRDHVAGRLAELGGTTPSPS